MTRHLLDRLGQSLIVLLAVSFVVYGLIGLMPGDPIDLMVSADPNLTSADAQRLRALYGLDRPILARWGAWLQAALGGDFGYSRLYAKPVLDVLWPALGNTVLLLGGSLLAALVIGLPAGIFAALRPYSTRDYLINGFAFAGISMPPFWLGLLLILLFAVGLEWLPAGGLPSDGGGLGDYLRYLALPVASLALAGAGGHTRYMRAAMIEVMRQDFIRTARAKGLSQARVVLGHGLRNAMIPVVTILGLDFGYLFSGALVTETVFAVPGMGKLIFDAIMGNDFNLALIALLFGTALTLLGNLLADLGYLWLDPRVSFSEIDQ